MSEAPRPGTQTMRVPLSWSGGRDGVVMLPYLRFACTGSDSARAPTVVLLAGGPGESGIESVLTGGHFAPLVNLIQQRAHVVAFDQRGAAGSNPSIEPTSSWHLDPSHAATREAVLDRAWRAAADATDRWRSEGLDADDFNICASARDISALLDLLEVERCMLFGASYGSQLGLTFLRDAGHRISRCVFVNVEAPHQTIKLPASVDRALRAILESGLVGTFPAGAFEMLGELMLDLARRPQRVEIGGRIVEIGELEARRIIARGIGRRSFVEWLAGQLGCWAAGDFTGLAGEVAQWKASPFGGLQHVVDVASGISPSRRQQLEDQRGGAVLQDLTDFPLPYIAGAYEITDLGEEHRREFGSAAPVLFVSGGLDARTPPQNVEELLPRFPNSAHIVKDDGMHEMDGYLVDDAIRRAVLDWLLG